jgi:hypothetical protein
MTGKTKVFGLATLILGASTSLANSGAEQLPSQSDQNVPPIDSIRLKMTPEQRKELLQVIESLDVEDRDWTSSEGPELPSTCCALR